MIFLRTCDEEGTVEPYCPKCEFSNMNAGAWAKIDEESAAMGVDEGLIRNRCTRCGEPLLPTTKAAFVVTTPTGVKMTICRGCHEAWPKLTLEKIVLNSRTTQTCDICEGGIFK